jgi:hypothetical protein
MSLAIPARLGVDELGVLGWALLRLFQPTIATVGVDEDAVGAQVAKLQRVVPAGLIAEHEAHAAEIQGFDHNAFARDLKIARLRAGFCVSGSLLPGLTFLSSSVGVGLSEVLGHPIAQGLIAFALTDDR